MNDQTLEFDRVPAVLSPQGRARREEILGELHRTRANRRTRRIAIRVGVLVVVASAVVLGLRTPKPAAVSSHDESPEVALETVPFIHLVGGEPSTIRVLSGDGPRLIRVLTDDQLLSSLRDAGQPDGIAIVGGKFMLASQIAAEDVQTN